MAKRRECTKSPIVESDDENNLIDSDEWKIGESSSKTGDAMENVSNQCKNTQVKTKTDPLPVEVQEENLESFGIDASDFDPTKHLRLNTKNKRSNHPIWDLYGVLLKDGREVSKAKSRIFCKRCFEQKKIKR